MSKSFKDKLKSFEVQPPSAAWDYISANLMADNEMRSVSDKLYDFEVLPPPHAWDTIKVTIGAGHTTAKNPSVRKISSPYFKYLTAAALLGIVALGILYFNKNQDVKDKLKIAQAAKIDREKIPPQESPTESSSSAVEPEPEEITEPPMASTFKINKSYIESTKVLQNTTVKNSLFHGNELQIMVPAKPIRNARGEIIQNPEIMNNPLARYISITSPNGQQTKISSKFLHMLLFINDASDIDEVDGYFDKNFMESLIWKSRFQDWRNEIMNTSFVPSSTNFMDILDFKDLIMKDK